MSSTVFIDGGPPRGLPAATGVSSGDGIVVAQGGTPGAPGTAIVREATVAQILAAASFLPIAGGTITGDLRVNGTTTLGASSAPTAAPGTNTAQLATTAFDTAAVLVETNRATTAEALLAPKANPALTGLPTAPTAPLGTNTTQLATTAFTAQTVAAALFSPSQAPGGLFGMTLANDGTTPNTVLDIAAGICADSTNTTAITLGAITKSIAGGWAAGTGANGMGTGLIATLSTWYHVFAIINGGLADVYFDTSITAVNKPLGTTVFRRIGSIFLDGAVHITRFSQSGDRFDVASPGAVISGVVGDTVAHTLLVMAPPGVVTTALLSAWISDVAVANTSVYISSLAQTDLATSGTNFSAIAGLAGSSNATTNMTVVTNTNSQVRFRLASATTSLVVTSTGWIDARGK
jgi:hypothetical protein